MSGIKIKTDSGLALKDREARKTPFHIEKSSENEYTLKYKELKFRVAKERFTILRLNPEEPTYLDDATFCKLAPDVFHRLRNELLNKTIDAFPIIFSQKEITLSDPDKFVLEIPGFIHWGLSIGGSGNVYLGALLEGWDKGLLLSQDKHRNKLLVLSVQKGLSGFRVGKAYDSKRKIIIDVQSPVLLREHFYQMVELRNRYYTVSRHNSLFDLQNFLDNLS